MEKLLDSTIKQNISHIGYEIESVRKALRVHKIVSYSLQSQKVYVTVMMLMKQAEPYEINLP